MQDLKTGAERLVWERPVLRRLDASDARQNDNMKSIEDLNAGPHLGDIMGHAATS
jgi:hypothetical protein